MFVFAVHTAVNFTVPVPEVRFLNVVPVTPVMLVAVSVAATEVPPTTLARLAFSPVMVQPLNV